jgi:hypothetical protein
MKGEAADHTEEDASVALGDASAKGKAGGGAGAGPVARPNATIPITLSLRSIEYSLTEHSLTGTPAMDSDEVYGAAVVKSPDPDARQPGEPNLP